MKENIITGILSAVAASVAAYFNIIAIPVAVLICLMIIDYITGMTASYILGKLSSKKGIIGILKKLGYLGLICVGIGIDYLLLAGLAQVGIKLSISMCIGALITIWLIINELVSILENIARMGVPVPNFIKKILEKLKISVEEKK